MMGTNKNYDLPVRTVKIHVSVHSAERYSLDKLIPVSKNAFPECSFEFP